MTVSAPIAGTAMSCGGPASAWGQAPAQPLSESLSEPSGLGVAAGAVRDIECVGRRPRGARMGGERREDAPPAGCHMPRAQVVATDVHRGRRQVHRPVEVEIAAARLGDTAWHEGLHKWGLAACAVELTSIDVGLTPCVAGG